MTNNPEGYFFHNPFASIDPRTLASGPFGPATEKDAYHAE